MVAFKFSPHGHPKSIGVARVCGLCDRSIHCTLDGPFGSLLV
jgi:hypothetical protein